MRLKRKNGGELEEMDPATRTWEHFANLTGGRKDDAKTL